MCIQAMAQEDVDLLELVQRRATKVISMLQTSSVKKKKLREVGFLAQEDSLGTPYQGLSVLKGNFGDRETYYQGL